MALETGWVERGQHDEGKDEDDSEYDCGHDYNEVCNQWFAPKTDVAALYYTPGDETVYVGLSSYAEDPITEMIQYARRCQGALIPAWRIHHWDGCRAGIDFDVLPQLKEYFVCLEMVMVHATAEEMLDSSLFGRLGEEYVQLVDPMDETTMRKFHQLSMQSEESEIPETKEFFKSAMDTKAFQERVRTWSQQVTFSWIWPDWCREQKHGFHGIPHPEEIWLGPKVDEKGEPYDMLSRKSFSGAIMWDFPVMTRFVPNKEHPWVSERLAKMPTFRPRIMFRPCQEKCWLPKRPSRSQRGRGGILRGGR